VLLQGLLDHAPLFPPASLPLSEALAEDGRASASDDAFALGRLVWPASRLAELPETQRALSVLVDSPFEPRQRVEAVEGRVGDDLDALAGLAEVAYVEVPLDDGLERTLAEIRRRGLRGKVRCASDGTPPDRLGSFLREARALGVAYKATAGLHHAVRTEHEHGLLNVLAAAVFGDEEDALAEEDPSAFELSPAAFRWRDRVAGPGELAEARSRRLQAVGSCSFFEPVEELRALGALAS
jgi:hypothetical protein